MFIYDSHDCGVSAVRRQPYTDKSDAIHPGLTRPGAPDTGILDDAKNGLIPSPVPFSDPDKTRRYFQSIHLFLLENELGLYLDAGLIRGDRYRCSPVT